ncbi:MAG: hypothetical protein IPN86_17885 [Saprospiraceae bacterium]|nr:hypothetical protein [Saprospiraceae bacterium]
MARKCRIDRNKKRYDILSFNGSFHDSKLYTWDQEGFVYLDLETNVTHKIKLQNFYLTGLITIDSDPNIHFVFQDSTNIYRFLANNTIDTIACFIPKDSKILYYCHERIIYGFNDDEDNLRYCMKDLSTCEDIFCEEFPLNSGNNFIRFQDTKSLYETIILIFDYRWQLKPNYYLYDIKNDLKTEVIINGYPNIYNNTLRIKNNLYFNKPQSINYNYDSKDDLYKLNLETGVTSLLIQSTLHPSNIILSDVTDEENINVSYQYNGGYSIMQLNEKEGEIKEIFQQGIIKNVGIQPDILADLWVENKYFAATCDAVYVMDENKSTKILDIAPYRCKISDIIRKDEHLYILAGEGETTFIVKIDIDNLNFTKINLPNTFKMGSTKLTTNQLLVNYANDDVPTASYGYFDMNVDKYVSMDSLNAKKGSIIQVSGNHILYQSNALYLLDPVANKTLPLNINGVNLSQGVIPDDKGGFYINGNNKFSYINSDGQLSTLLENFDYKYFRSSKPFGDTKQSFAFYNSKEVVIVTIQNGVVPKKLKH